MVTDETTDAGSTTITDTALTQPTDIRQPLQQYHCL